MDQARFFIVVAVILCMMFALAILQKIYKPEGAEDENAGQSQLAARYDRSSYQTATAYSSLEEKKIPLAPPSRFCVETPNEADQQKKSMEMSQRTKWLFEMFTYERKLWAGVTLPK